MNSFSTDLFCYICDNVTNLSISDKLLCKLTNTTRVSFPKVISTLISDEFVLIVGKEDVVCNQCTDLVNRLDELQHEVFIVRKTLSEFLAKKYHIPIIETCEDIDGEKEDVEKDNKNHSPSESSELDTTDNQYTDLQPNLNNKACLENKKNKWEDKRAVTNSIFESTKVVCENSKVNDSCNTSLNTNFSVSNGENTQFSDICFSSLEVSDELNCVDKLSKNSGATYLVCEICQSLFKSASDINNHICQNEHGCLQTDEGTIYKSVTPMNDNPENRDKDDDMVEITIIENLMDKESTEVLKKEIKSKLGCFICDSVLGSRLDLARHVLSHYPVQKSSKKGTICPICQVSFLSLHDFMNHYDTHVNSSGFKGKCKESVILNKSLKSNVRQDTLNDSNHHKVLPFSCPFCRNTHNSASELNDHLRLLHNINTCHFCGKEFPSDLKLKEHLVIHEAKIKPNQCEFCLIRFNSPKELENHIETAHDQIKTTKACPLCRKRCGSSFSVKRHIMKNHLIPVLQQEIREKYSHGSDLVDDMKSLGASEKFIKSITDINKSSVVENNLKQFKMIVNIEASDVNFCLLCGFSSKSVPNLDKHRKKHSTKKIPCPLMCEHLSCDADELISHLSDLHKTALSINCCPHCLNEPDEDITLHMKALHSKFYTHLTCCVCKEMFFSKENLKYHFSITHLISEQQFEEKGDDIEMDENSVEVDDPLENCSRESADDNIMSNELSIALESITHNSTESSVPSNFEENGKNLTLQYEENKTVETEMNENVCVICRKECTSSEDLTKHISKHSEEPENIECPLCTETLHDKEHLHIHVVKEHPLNAQNYCFSCEKSFSTRNTFVKHLNTKCSNRTCAVCNKRFANIAPFVQHMAYGHRKDLVCVHCKKLCKSLKHLKYHEKVHVKYKGKVFKCNTCSKTFQTPNSLKSHSVCHTGNYPFVCEFCGRGFLSSYYLSEHRASHTGDIRYCCEICGKSFRLYDTYHRHRRQHDNPFPAQCSECGKRFRNSSRVSEHKRKVHTGERPYACPYCPMTFNVTSSYRIHLCKHTNVYPYNCDLCKRGFASRFKYGNHRATKHNDNSFINAKHDNSLPAIN